MGMFDNLTCDYLLPKPGFEGRTFQTKDLECALLHYHIGSDGYLYEMVGEYEPVPEEQRPHYGKPEWNHPLAGEFFRLRGAYRRVGTRKVRRDYHGDIVFYDFRIPGDAASELVEFKARFTNGRLEWIRRLSGGVGCKEVGSERA